MRITHYLGLAVLLLSGCATTGTHLPAHQIEAGGYVQVRGDIIGSGPTTAVFEKFPATFGILSDSHQVALASDLPEVAPDRHYPIASPGSGGTVFHAQYNYITPSGVTKTYYAQSGDLYIERTGLTFSAGRYRFVAVDAATGQRIQVQGSFHAKRLPRR